MATDYGADINALDNDFDVMAYDITGVEVFKQDLIRRFTTETGSLWYDRSYGLNVRAALSQARTADGRASLQTAIVAQALLDERVDSAEAGVTYSFQSETATVSIRIVGSEGPFDLVLGISDVTVEILNSTA